jgi:hypothetical protein
MNEKKNDKLKSKEDLYTLFYEIISEIKGCKIEMDEEEFQENIQLITMDQLINYIKDALNILINQKVYESKEKQKKNDFKELFNLKQIKNSDYFKYENSLKKLEENERKLIKQYFQEKLHKEFMENKLDEYIDIEDEFEEMKKKLKYEDRRLLNNDKKEQQIIKLRQENINLKKEINYKNDRNKKIVNNITDKEKEIESLKKAFQNLKIKIEEKEKELNLFSNININIINNSYNQQTKNSNYYSTNNTITKIVSNTTKTDNNNIISHNITNNNLSLKDSHSLKLYLLKKTKSKDFLKNKKPNFNYINYTRNQLFNRNQMELLSKRSSKNKSQNYSYNNVKIKQINKSNQNIRINNNYYLNPKFPSLKENNENNQLNIFSYMRKYSFTTRKKQVDQI